MLFTRSIELFPSPCDHQVISVENYAKIIHRLNLWKCYFEKHGSKWGEENIPLPLKVMFLFWLSNEKYYFCQQGGEIGLASGVFWPFDGRRAWKKANFCWRWRRVNHSPAISYTIPGNSIVFNLDIQKSYYFPEISYIFSWGRWRHRALASKKRFLQASGGRRHDFTGIKRRKYNFYGVKASMRTSIPLHQNNLWKISPNPYSLLPAPSSFSVAIYPLQFIMMNKFADLSLLLDPSCIPLDWEHLLFGLD